MFCADDRKINGFTLIELLVVIAIIGVLAGVVIAQVTSARDKARIAKGQAFERHMRSKLALTEVGDWSFDNIVGISAPDTSGNGYNGTIVGGATEQTTGCADTSCLEFDGVNDYVDTSDHDFTTGGFTLSAWFQTSSNTVQPIIRKRAAGGDDGDIFIEVSTNDVLASLVDSCGTTAVATVDNDFSNGKWHHVALVVDDTQLQLFVNGDLRATGPHDNVLTTNNETWKIGANTIDGEYFDGRIDSVRIYERALTDSEVGFYYDQEVPRYVYR